MNLFNFVVNLFTPAGFVQIIQFLIVILEILYGLFAFIVVRQVRLMNSSFKTSYASVFTFLAFVHFFLAIGLVAISILSL